MKALVTGGGGFLGLYLVEQLVDRGVRVRVFCRGDYPRLRELGVEIVRGDVRDAAAVRQACAGMETVFHVAALPGVWGTWRTYHDINTLGTQHVLQACQTQGVRRLIYTSSPSVVFDGQPHDQGTEELPYPSRYLCHYPHSKALAEQQVLAANQDTGLLTCALRPHLVWGPRDNHLIPRLLQRALAGRLRQVGPGTNRISMTYVENAAAAHLQAADHLQPGSPVAGQAYFINEPEPVNLWNWINEILTLAGLPEVRKRLSATSAYRLGGLLETIYGTFGLSAEPPMTRFVALQLSQSHTYSIEKARRDFGFTPLVDYATGLSRLVADFPRMLGDKAL
ncbi:MAG: NAD-dependent epimerase/dehydratase family protein [Planctomycetaceae bacterium]|nr:NAD-dependent epimerase/dehydratase family protein [Planctomycetaceae bacterium]